MATNLFSKAKKTAAKETTKPKDEKVRIKVEDASFFEKIASLEKLQDTVKSAEAKISMIADEVKDTGKRLWAAKYTQMEKNPGSVMLEARKDDEIAQVMLLPSDKYITINAERADELRETYGNDIVEETTTFAFDNEMVDKYGETISNLIEMSDEISEADKAKIIKAVTKFSVAKGTIDKFKVYGGADVFGVMEAVRPVVALKGPEVIKG
jgi:dihydroxyacetone kinase-like predicted kinase